MADQEEMSVGWVAVLLALLVGYFGWAFLAADYFQNGPAGGQGRTSFWVNSIVQIPNLFSVVSHALQNRLWLVGLIAILEVVVFVLWRVLNRLQRELWSK